MSLFSRSTHGVQLTPVGQKLYPEARKLLQQAEVVEDLLAQDSVYEAPVKLAISPTIAEFILPKMLVELEQQHKTHLALELSTSISRSARASVRSGNADLGIVAKDTGDAELDGLKEVPFFDCEIVVAVPLKHPWAKLKEIPLDLFLETPLVVRDPSANSRRVVSAKMDELGLELAPPVAELGDTKTVIETAVAECAPALLARIAVDHFAEDVVSRHVEGLRFPRQFVIVLPNSKEALAANARSLLRHLFIAHPSIPQE